MSFDSAIKALSTEALTMIRNNQVIGLGSGRAASTLVRELAKKIKLEKINIRGIPTSLQIKLIAQEENIPLIEADQIDTIDIVFDGADQIDSKGFLIKGGGGALFRENILINMAKKVVIMADSTKFVEHLSRSVPVEVHWFARTSVIRQITEMGGTPNLRLLDRGYPFITENGNIILDCDFGTINDPISIQQKIISIAGVIECGIFTKKPDIIFRANMDGSFEKIIPTR